MDIKSANIWLDLDVLAVWWDVHTSECKCFHLVAERRWKLALEHEYTQDFGIQKNIRCSFILHERVTVSALLTSKCRPSFTDRNAGPTWSQLLYTWGFTGRATTGRGGRRRGGDPFKTTAHSSGFRGIWGSHGPGHTERSGKTHTFGYLLPHSVFLFKLWDPVL